MEISQIQLITYIEALNPSYNRIRVTVGLHKIIIRDQFGKRSFINRSTKMVEKGSKII
jgi:hypothetical protein